MSRIYKQFIAATTIPFMKVEVDHVLYRSASVLMLGPIALQAVCWNEGEDGFGDSFEVPSSLLSLSPTCSPIPRAALKRKEQKMPIEEG
jgi:hypothetical protein